MPHAILLEDNKNTHEYLKSILSTIDNLQLVGSFYTLHEARSFCHYNKIDFAIIDIKLLDGSGIELITMLNKQQPECKKLVATIYDDMETFLDSLRHGTNGYLLKNSTENEIRMAIDYTLKGNCFISPQVAGYLLGNFRKSEDKKHKDIIANQLTPREVEVLQLLAIGLSYHEAGQTLGIKYNTISSYIKNIYMKLGVTSKTAAVFSGFKQGLVSLTDE